jgi:hypothetical protein
MLTDKHRLPSYFVIPAQAGIQFVHRCAASDFSVFGEHHSLDSGLRRNDDVDSNANP